MTIETILYVLILFLSMGLLGCETGLKSSTGIIDKEQIIIAIIDEVGLHDKINNRGAELSGGQKQRCVIARALAFEPEILACDEPTGNLDSKTGAEIMALIHEIAKDKLVLVVTHNYEEVEPYATRKLTIVDGSLYEDKILREVPCDDEKEVLNLDYVPIPKKINFKVALRNLIKNK